MILDLGDGGQPFPDPLRFHPGIGQPPPQAPPAQGGDGLIQRVKEAPLLTVVRDGAE